MRLLHTADCHLGNFMLDGDKEKEAFAALIEAAIAIGPDVLVVAGDLFDHGRVSDDVIAWTLEQMSRLDCPVIVLPGNHDYDVLMRIAAGAHLAAHPGITIITAPDGELIHLPEAGLTLWGRALEDHTPDHRPLLGIPDRPDNGWCVVLGHGLIVDALNSGGRGSPIFPADVEAVGWDYVALGHVHTHRIIRICRRRRWCTPGRPPWRTAAGPAPCWWSSTRPRECPSSRSTWPATGKTR